MLLSVQELRLLRLLKAVQQTESGFVELDYESQCAKSCPLPGGDSSAPLEKSLDPVFASLSPTLDALEKHGCVRFMAPNSYAFVQLTHAGWHLLQFSALWFVKFVVCSILVPALVAWLTSRCRC